MNAKTYEDYKNIGQTPASMPADPCVDKPPTAGLKSKID